MTTAREAYENLLKYADELVKRGNRNDAPVSPAPTPRKVPAPLIDTPLPTNGTIKLAPGECRVTVPGPTPFTPAIRECSI